MSFSTKRDTRGNATLLLIGSLLVGLHRRNRRNRAALYLENTIEKVEGMRPYSAELPPDIYVREGCTSVKPNDPSLP